MTVMVAGQITRDLVLTVSAVPAAGEAADAGARREMLGGKGANQAVALAQLGVPVGLLGVAGADETGERLLDQARTDGIDVSSVSVRGRSALIVELLDAEGEWRYVQHLPEESLLSPDDVRAAAHRLATADAVVLQLQQPPEALLAAARAARGTERAARGTDGAARGTDGAARGTDGAARGTDGAATGTGGTASGPIVVLDGAPGDDALLGWADVIRADEQEAGLLVGEAVGTEERGLRAAREIHRRGPWLAVLALEGGANLFAWSARSPWGADGHVVIPGVQTAKVDTTGAGDSLVAGLVAALLRGDDPASAAKHAVAAASSTLGHPGGRPDLTPESLTRQLALIDDALRGSAR
ncbi:MULTISPECIES: PfkB family carbohydrate kinase [Catenuloplanes]|uniref:Ribokinase n=1 Tax=Catenuloplanes niger TaxID=587534 RepID=A0AAE3ZX42_9ACTN|nr:PfkB family carbohydrate kinase [Catenuloplanes niger]MDR7326466.1 ribokinase [Catenuloplanes niger]